MKPHECWMDIDNLFSWHASCLCLWYSPVHTWSYLAYFLKWHTSVVFSIHSPWGLPAELLPQSDSLHGIALVFIDLHELSAACSFSLSKSLQDTHCYSQFVVICEYKEETSQSIVLSVDEYIRQKLPQNQLLKNTSHAWLPVTLWTFDQYFLTLQSRQSFAYFTVHPPAPHLSVWW